MTILFFVGLVFPSSYTGSYAGMTEFDADSALRGSDDVPGLLPAAAAIPGQPLAKPR